ncbi:MAG: hypothetical protein JW918_16585 [Anaerolineae bacterium]|nr:hypothetical protein [Anaerolineae bacterium]
MNETPSLTARALPASIALTAGALALAYGLNGSWSIVIAIAVLGGLWLLGLWRGWGWTASVGLACFVIIAAVGLGMSLRGIWMLAGVVGALSAWDLDHFAHQLRKSGQVKGARTLERRHLQRLLIVDGASLLLGAVALGARIEFSFGAALLLGALATLGLTRAIGFLRRQGEGSADPRRTGDQRIDSQE